jgi:hypothetical protein
MFVISANRGDYHYNLLFFNYNLCGGMPYEDITVFRDFNQLICDKTVARWLLVPLVYDQHGW